MDEFNSWHFSDKVYNPDDLELDIKPLAYFQEPSAPWLLARAMQTFNLATHPWAFNFMLRFAVHVVGDVHQPMHAVNGYFNNSVFGQFLRSDFGGNLIKIETPPSLNGEINNLHFLWDLAGGLYGVNWPYSKQQLDDLRSNATALLHEFPRSSLHHYRPTDLDPCVNWKNDSTAFHHCLLVFKTWIDEAHDVAVAEAYGHGIRPHVVPSSEYLANAQAVSRRQIALAGYRVADLLRGVLPRLPPRRDASLFPAGAVEPHSWLQMVLPVVCFALTLVVLLLSLKIRSLQAQLRSRKNVDQSILLSS